MPALKAGPKIALIVLGVAAAIFGLRAAMTQGWIPTPGILKAAVPLKVVLPDVKDAIVQNVDPAPLPSDRPASVQAPLIRGGMWEWNAEANLIYANGGAETTAGSLMEKHGVNLHLERQDDNNNEMINGIVACAKELHDGAEACSTGYNFIVIMGDGAGGHYLSAMNPQLKKLGPDWQAVVIGSTGYSRGEDALLAPEEVKRNPKAALGLLFAGVKVDGDWNIALKWEGDNNLKNNPDPHTWDPDAVNWLLVDGYLQAAEAYNANQCEDRKVIKDGKLTGETKHVCVDGAVTWTPGDVNIAENRGGLVKVVSSKEYRSQMPAVIVGPKKFFEMHTQEVEGMLAATFEAGDQLKAFDKSLHKAADISAKLYNDQTGDYWYKYFKGTHEKGVDLGGSAVNNLADNLILFGMDSGSNDNFRSTYNVFQKIDMQQYPEQFKDTPIPPVAEIEDKAFIRGAQDLMANSGADADVQTYSASDSGEVISNRSYHINFATGSAQLSPDALETMQELKDGLAITGLSITVDGHTDNTGNPEKNMTLSAQRAASVESWLQRAAPKNFPENRFLVHGYGDTKPVASNTTDSGRAQNRRVEITLSE
jgi:OmpA-OmpF porin, OOP family